MPCRICGEMVVLAPLRYAELVRAGAYPVCRKNGCYQFERYSSATNPVTDGEPEGASTYVATMRLKPWGAKRRRKVRPLATGRVKRGK